MLKRCYEWYMENAVRANKQIVYFDKNTSIVLLFYDYSITTQSQFYNYRRVPFWGLQSCVCEVQGNHFHESTLVSSLQSAIHVTIEVLLILGEKNFMEVPKIHEICSPWQKVSYCTNFKYLWPDLRKPDIMTHFSKSRFLHKWIP